METDTNIEFEWKEKISSLDEIPGPVMIRKTVFVEEQKAPEDSEFDDYDFKSPHLIVFWTKSLLEQLDWLIKRWNAALVELRFSRSIVGKE